MTQDPVVEELDEDPLPMGEDPGFQAELAATVAIIATVPWTRWSDLLRARALK